ncbi:glutathione S-transferase family protein [Halomonas sabkhae]|uniref:glutathione S-transferase family protein n=1 Tax=Halomonas sabkhae TaxID=626223 RepID=UPI0025B51CB1|nr:glutathione S-transferase family protein [Halomonas sabkhae]MDN3524570.1 glutathione S-transferase family protein [Halomonas sabkhae]
MSNKPVLYGYSPSSYVFSVRILLAGKSVAYDQVPLDVIAGEPRSAEHRRLHPFGKVPVLVHDGLRMLETSAIMRYINDAFGGASFIPDNPRDRARMDMAMGLHESYGYAAMARVVGYHRFPKFAGHPSREDVEGELERLHTLFAELMRLRGDSPYIAGDLPSLADFFVAPACFYLEEVGETGRFLDLPGFAEWWARVNALPEYQTVLPDLSQWGEQAG